MSNRNCIILIFLSLVLAGLYLWQVVYNNSLIDRVEATEKYIYGAIKSDLRLIKNDRDLSSILEDLEKTQRQLKLEVISIWRMLDLIQNEIVARSKS